MPNPPIAYSQPISRIYTWFSCLLEGDLELLEGLLAHGVPVDVPHPLRHSTALMEATRLGRTDLVQWLLQHGAAPAFLSGMPIGTPLHCALRRHHWSIANLLMQQAAVVNVADAFERTPLQVLCMETLELREISYALKIAEVLIKRGCPLDARDIEGTAALHHCVINDLSDLAMLLLSHGAQVNITVPETGVTPLAIAALEKNNEMAELLLAHGADPYQTTRDGLCPAHLMPHILQTDRHKNEA